MKNKLSPKAVELAQTRQALIACADRPYEKCRNCGSELFERALKLKTVPGVALGQKETAVMYFGVYVCKDCNRVWEGTNESNGATNLAEE